MSMINLQIQYIFDKIILNKHRNITVYTLLRVTIIKNGEASAGHFAAELSEDVIFFRGCCYFC